MEHTYLRIIFIIFILALSSCGGGDSGAEIPNPTSTDILNLPPANTNTPLTPTAGPTFSVELPCVTNVEAGVPPRWLDPGCDSVPETIQIPDGRPIYALLVSGFYQNSNLDMFHWYRFAQSLHEKGAYVHYAWWNNLLAPYMERPLHNTESSPGYEPFPDHDITGFFYTASVPNKALPAEDHQFQADARRLLAAIRDNNPDAKIILVGHSMGGDAIARLASNPNLIDSDGEKIEIALVAPIDPVGNRTCLFNDPNHTPLIDLTLWPQCWGYENFTRKQVMYIDYYDNLAGTERDFDFNINYLYHRWQTEFAPPQKDYGPLEPVRLFKYHGGYSDRVNTIFEGSTNVQSRVSTLITSGYAARWDNPGGGLDGHGEIVGFRGVKDLSLLDLLNFAFESYPLGLAAQGNWPSRDQELNFEDENDPVRLRRVELMKLWDADPYYLERPHGETVPYAPKNPELCMVSSDLSTILNTVIAQAAANSSPLANAGPDQIVECTAPGETKVFLDGSGSTDPDGTIVDFSWNWAGNNSAAGDEIFAYLPLGTHMFTLTVTDNGGLTGTDTVDVTVQDTIAPTLSVTLSPNVLWPPNHKLVKVTASIDVSDSCDDIPVVKLVSIASNEPDDKSKYGQTGDDIQGAEFGTDDREFLLRAERSGNGVARIYKVTYSATDSSGNVTYASAEVTVPHDHGKSK